MKKSIQIGGAFVGVIVGAGFASGQEIMQYFTSFGWQGIIGGLIATIGFAILGMSLTQLGNEIQTTSHKEVIRYIGGRFFGPIMDFIVTFFLFGVAVVMFAGSSSTFDQMFGINPMVGSLFMVIVTIITLTLNLKSIINLIAVVTPYLFAIVLIISIYSMFTMDLSFAELNTLSKQQSTAAPNWIVSALLYVSYNIAVGAPMLTVMGSAVKDRKVAGWGGIIGGIILGILIFLINMAMFTKMDVVGGKELPMLELANEIHPIVGILMSIALLCMMYNTAVGTLYAFIVRFIGADHKYFKLAVLIVGILGFFASFVGFTTLVGKVYSTVGYLGFAIIIAIIISWFRKRSE